jgi:hypothetical protein
MYDAQRKGVKAMSTQKWARTIGKWGLGLAGLKYLGHLLP